MINEKITRNKAVRKIGAPIKTFQLLCLNTTESMANWNKIAAGRNPMYLSEATKAIVITNDKRRSFQYNRPLAADWP
jgi:hypothetical protein